MNQTGQNIGYRFFELISGKNVFGDCETVVNDAGMMEILIKRPYTAIGGQIFPYLFKDIGDSPKAFQIHPMNIMFQVPLDEFPNLYDAYKQVTSSIITPDNKIII